MSSAKFIILDSIVPRFIVPAISVNLNCTSNIKDSLSKWLFLYGYSAHQTNCDTIFHFSNFDGDSTKNPIIVTFYIQNRCGKKDSTTASFSYRKKIDTLQLNQYSCLFPKNSVDTLTLSSNGCDSIVVINKIKRYPDTTIFNLISCDPKIKLHDTTILQNQYFCDSVILTSYEFKPIDTTHLKIYNCAYTRILFDTLILNGQFCDSIILTQYIPLRSDSVFIQKNTCDSLDVV